jgi:type II secretion system protein G
MKSLKSNKGFTLIELVVVIAILGILAGIAIPRFMDATATARGAKIVADMRTIDSAIMMYNAKTGGLPTAVAQLTTDSTAASSYKLLAAWPVPPSGNAIITKNNGSTSSTTIASTGVTYTLGTTGDSAGRAVLSADSKTVDGILSDGF